MRKGYFTYNQAKNIAKAGTVESLTYDLANGAIIATSALGVTALITLAASMWNGEDFDKSLKYATYSGLKVGGTTLVVSVLASQLSKMGLNSAMVNGSEAIVAFLGPKASAVLANAFRSGSSIYGAAAMKSAAKLLRGNIITTGVTVVVLSAFDIADIFNGRLSGKQLFKNVTGTVATVAGGTGGWLGGAALGSLICPGIGSVIGGILGSVVAGAASSAVTDAAMDAFIEDDAEEMVRIIEKVFTDLAADYLLSQSEAERISDRLKDKLDGDKLKDMYASNNHYRYAKEMLMPLIEAEVRKRKHIRAVTEDEMIISMKDVLEELAEAADA